MKKYKVSRYTNKIIGSVEELLKMTQDENEVVRKEAGLLLLEILDTLIDMTVNVEEALHRRNKSGSDIALNMINAAIGYSSRRIETKSHELFYKLDQEKDYGHKKFKRKSKPASDSGSGEI